ncbi:MAG: glutamine-synthetase adenylyltransferase [Paracoccaceae bacterium]
MNFASRITRCPRSHEPDRGREIGALMGALAPELRQVLIGAGGSSPYLYAVIEREADWLRQALSMEPEAALEAVLSTVDDLRLSGLSDGLRAAKRRVSVLVALADLAGVWDLDTVTGALTRFADLSVARCVSELVGAEIARGKLPDAPTAGLDAAGMAVLAMGKMGAFELNFSSDIDLICLFDDSRYRSRGFEDARAAFIRVTRRMTAILSDMTGQGYVFRVDLRLRPDASVTPVCLPMETAERYYESVGRTWERAAHIKARVCAGDMTAGKAYLDRLRPFVWRKHLDFAAIQDAHDMRLRIREHRGFSGPIVLEGHNIKLGAGGIREIEFFTQTRQIIAGGRDASLRVRGTLEGLARLSAKGWVPGDVVHTLSTDYATFREIEHRLQMVADAQTHDLPNTAEDFARLAALCGRDPDELRRDLKMRLGRVAALTEGFFAPRNKSSAGTELSESEAAVVARWRSYACMRSSRAVQIFERLKPEIFARLHKAARPGEALLQFDGFLAGLPAGVQVFSLFEANRQLIDLIIDITSTAPRLAAFLGRNSQVFDAVIGGDFFAPWPGVDALKAELDAVLSEAAGYEDKLNAARRWMKEWHFRIGVHHLRGLIDGANAGREYSGLADAVVNAVWPVAHAEFAAKHGPAPGRGAVVLGMGSLGAGRLSAASDLDLIIIYDADGVENSKGRRPLAARSYYARLTQALVTALSAPMAEGRLYQVDMRLRPSGRQGPVATSIGAFRDYQSTQAWTWEHLALTRARVVAGDPALGERVDEFRAELLAQSRDRTRILADVTDMRARLFAAKPGVGAWDAKLGRGRMLDIEMIAQSAALLSGDPARSVASQLEVAETAGWLTAKHRRRLQAAYDLLSDLQMATRLLTEGPLELETIGQGGTRFLLRETGAADVDALARALDKVTRAAAVVIDGALGASGKPG